MGKEAEWINWIKLKYTKILWEVEFSFQGKKIIRVALLLLLVILT